MSDAARQLMDVDEFLLWSLDQEDTYELIDGIPVLKHRDGPEGMAGTSLSHARLSSNLQFALRSRLRGGRCEVLSDAMSVRTSIRKARRPDVLVDCGRGRGSELEAPMPVVLFEILSPSSGKQDLIFKPEEYKRLPTMRQYVVVDSTAAVLKVWVRGEDGRWEDGLVEGLTAALDIPALSLQLPLEEIYENVDLTPDGAF